MDNNLDLQYALDADIETAFDSFVDAIYDEVMNDEMKTTIIFCDEVILENGRENSFCKLLQEVTSFSISKAAEDTLRLDMNIAGVWQTA